MRCASCLLSQVWSTQREVETLKSVKYELMTSVNGLKKELDVKEERIQGLLAERSALEQQRAAPARPSDGEVEHLARPTEKNHVEELTKQLKSANNTIERLELQMRQMGPTSPTTQVNWCAVLHQTLHDLPLSATQMPFGAHTKQINQLMNLVEEEKMRRSELEKEYDHLRQSRAEMSTELNSSRGRTEVSP